MGKLGRRQVAVLVEAAYEVAVACPWVWIDGDRREVDSLSAKGLLGSTSDAFGITPLGCLTLRHYDRALAREAIAGLRRERDAGSVMPWVRSDRRTASRQVSGATVVKQEEGVWPKSLTWRRKFEIGKSHRGTYARTVAVQTARRFANTTFTATIA